ncbi:MAG: hypothetical protein NTW19_25160 [Planctomycetota bacterium]|nr:hypothetical protein [Planctomycetota bacterium]
MSISLPQRDPQNAPGDFYVEADVCMRCCLSHDQAPELLNDWKKPFKSCFFQRQPRTTEEIDHAVMAAWVSEVKALRYGGTDEKVIAKMRKKNLAYLCDHTAEGQSWNKECAVRRAKLEADAKARPPLNQ